MKTLYRLWRHTWRYRYPLVTAGFAALIGWQLYEIIFTVRDLSALVGAAYFTVLGALLAMLLWDGVQRARGR